MGLKTELPVYIYYDSMILMMSYQRINLLFCLNELLIRNLLELKIKQKSVFKILITKKD